MADHQKIDRGGVALNKKRNSFMTLKKTIDQANTKHIICPQLCLCKVHRYRPTSLCNPMKKSQRLHHCHSTRSKIRLTKLRFPSLLTLTYHLQVARQRAKTLWKYSTQVSLCSNGTRMVKTAPFFENVHNEIFSVIDL